MSRVLLAAALAGGAAAVLVALPQPGALRFRSLQPPAARRGGSAVRLSPLLLVLPVMPALGPVAAALALLGVLAFGRWSSGRAADRLRARERAAAVEACGVLAAELRSGRDPADALAAAAEVAAGPAREALMSAASAARLGGDVPSALTYGPGSAVAHVLRALGACWAVCSTSGSGLATAVERLEEGLRAEQAQRRAVAAELAGPRATAGLLAVLPVFGLLMAAGLGADPLHVLLGTPFGLVCLALGLGLDGLGLLWTGRLVRRAGAA